MRLTTLLRQADPLPDAGSELSARARAELRTLVGTEPDTVTPPVPARPRAGRALVLGVAGLAAVAVLLAPLLQRPVLGVPTPPAASPSDPSRSAAALGRWTPTTSAPIPGRRDAVTAWVAGSFLLVGGTTAPPCTRPDGCAEESGSRTDGARYDPASDSWSRISDSPVPLTQGGGSAGPYPAAVAINDTAYLLQGDAFLGYHAGSDRWTTLAAPPEPVYLAGVNGGTVLAFPGSVCGGPAVRCMSTVGMRYFSYDPTADRWVSHRTRLEIRPTVHGATVVDGRLVVSWLQDDHIAVASIDLASGTIGARASFSTDQRPMPVAVGGWAAWPRDTTRGWLFEPVSGTMREVRMPAEPGPFRVVVGGWKRNASIVGSGMIALGGELYDPRTGLWSIVPGLPGPDRDPVIAAGPGSILACHGWNGRSYADTCQLLRPAPADRVRP